MKTERIDQKKNTRIIQQINNNAGRANIVDNRQNKNQGFLFGCSLQRVEDDEEDVLQGKMSGTAQCVEEEDDEVLQGKMTAPAPKNETGLPDNLKAGVESLSGFSLDAVRVHYNSSKPATVQALAYTQGTDIHVAPGQEKHLPHEAWHVAQQMAGRVAPTTSVNGTPVNDNAALEREADEMGAKAVTLRITNKKEYNSVISSSSSIQRTPEDSAYQTYCSYCAVKGKTPMSREVFSTAYGKEVLENASGWGRITSGNWYRAFPINHYAYPEFYHNKVLSSEGPKNILSWSMFDAETRWLPGLVSENPMDVAFICGQGCKFPGYSKWAGALRSPSIIGVIVRKKLSEDFAGYYAHDPAAETQVKGPLTLNDIDEIYLVNFQLDIISIGKCVDFLPPPPSKNS